MHLHLRFGDLPPTDRERLHTYFHANVFPVLTPLAVDTVTTDLTATCLAIQVAPRLAGADLSLECWAASRKADGLAKVIGREVVTRPVL